MGFLEVPGGSVVVGDADVALIAFEEFFEFGVDVGQF